MEATALALDAGTLSTHGTALLQTGGGAFARESYLAEHLPYFALADDDVMVLREGDDDKDGKLSLAELNNHSDEFFAGTKDFFTIPSLLDSRIKAAQAKQHSGMSGESSVAAEVCSLGQLSGRANSCCLVYLNNPSMRIGRTWGKLPRSEQVLWQKRNCDQFKQDLNKAQARARAIKAHQH